MVYFSLEQEAQTSKSVSAAFEYLTPEIISSSDGLLAIRSEWDILYAKAGDGNPFLQWEWVLHWWAVYGEGTRMRRHMLQIIVLRDCHGTAQGIAPFVRTTWGVGQLSLRVLRLYGFDEATTDLRTCLLSPCWEAEAAKTLTAFLLKMQPTFDWCEWDGIADRGACFDLLSKMPRDKGISWTAPISGYLLSLMPTWEEMRAGLKRNVKENIRHSYNSLKREGVAWRFERISDPVEISAALSELFKLHAARSAMQDTLFHPDHYRSARSRLFLRQAVSDLATAASVSICRLMISGESVASRLVFSAHGALYLSSSGFDPKWRRYGVMTLLTTECIKYAIQNGYRTVNLSTGTDAAKTRWSPLERTYHTIQIQSSGTWSQWAARLHHKHIQRKKSIG